MKPLRLIVLTVLLLAMQACGGDAGEEAQNAEGRVEVEDFRYLHPTLRFSVLNVTAKRSKCYGVWVKRTIIPTL